MSGDKAMSSAGGSKHDSVETADHGFQFQLEILFFLCLQVHKMDCKDFSLGFEVNAIEKFDDIVIECEFNDKKFAFFLQAKHMAVKKEVYIKNFFATTQKDGSKKFWKKYNLRQFVESLMMKKNQESLKKYEDCTKLFVIVTNNSVNTDKIETINENCDEFQRVFKQFTKNKAQILKFGKAFEEKMNDIIDIILKEAPKSLISDDSRANPPKPMDLLRDIVVVANLPENLEEVSDKFVKKTFSDSHSNLLARFLRENTFDFIKVKESKRNYLTRKDFEEIIAKSKQEAELTGISEGFFQTQQFPLQFKTEVLHNLRQSIIEGRKRMIQCEGNLRSSIMKIYHSLKSTEVKVFLLPLSKITESSENYFKLPKSRILIYLDCVRAWRSMLDYENVIVIGEETELRDVESDEKFSMGKPLFDELDEKTRNIFFSRNIKIQDHLLELSKIKSIICKTDNLFVNFMNDLVEEVLTKKFVYFGLKLPDRNQLYVMRDFSLKDKDKIIFDEDHLMSFSNVIIEADPGMGKTSSIIELAKKFKEENPHYWVGVYFLNNYTRIFSKVNSCVSKDFAKDFLLNNLIDCESNLKLCKNLLEIYLEEEGAPIFLIFDGFDEIFPNYSNFVINLLQRFQEMNIRMFITSRGHCMDNLKAFTNFSQVKLYHFSVDQVKAFITKFVHLNYTKDVVEEILENTNNRILSLIVSETKLTTLPDKFLQTPMLLKMINEACKKRPDYLTTTEYLDVYKLYNDMFEMSFDDYYDKEKTDATSNPVKSGKLLQMKKVTEIYSNLAIAEMEMEDLIPPNATEFNEVEIIARGFVTKSPNGDFHFVHYTFAEYFLCEAIVREIVKKNFKIMDYVRGPRFLAIPYFSVNSLMDKMQKMTIEFNKPADLCEIFLFLFFQYSSINLSEFKIVIQYVSKKLSMRGMLYFLCLQFKYFNGLTQHHVDFLVEFSEEKYGRKVTNYLLSQLMSKTFGDTSSTIYFYTLFQSLLTSRGLQSDKESFERFYIEFASDFKTRPWQYRKETLFGVFEYRKTTILDEMTSKITSEYQSTTNFKTHDVILINYLTLFDENSQDFIENTLKFFQTRRILLSFLEKLVKLLQRISQNASTPYKLFNGKKKDCETFLRKCFEIFKESKCEEDLYEQKSLFFHCWSNQSEILVKALLKHLPNDTIETLVANPNFNGKSLIDFFLSDESKVFFPIDYLKHMHKNHQNDDIFKLAGPYSGADKSLVMLKAFHIYHNAFLLNNTNTISDQMFEELANKVINETLTIELKKQESLLYPFACNSKYFTLEPIFANNFFTRLNSHQRFLSVYKNYKTFLKFTMRRIDKNGNNLLHISSQRDNHNFFEYLQSHLSAEELEKPLSVQNSSGQNYFHCLTKNFEMWEKDKQISQERLQRLLLTPDNYRKTPFHRNDHKFFHHFIKHLDSRYASVLFALQDNNQDNVLHYLAKDIKGDKKLLKEFYQSIGESLFATMLKAFEAACSQVNSDGQTPGDVGGISIDSLRELIFENIQRMARNLEAMKIL